MSRARLPLCVLPALLLVHPAQSAEGHAGHTAPAVFSSFLASFDFRGRHGGTMGWEVDGWIGGDDRRLWLRSEGELVDGGMVEAEVEVFHGWNVDPFWDLLAGVRVDPEPDGRVWAALGLTGLAPMFLETQATLYLSDAGHPAARLKLGIDLAITQALILEPHAELNLFGRDMPARQTGTGVADVEAGLKLRYDMTPRFAPYADLVWHRSLGESAGRVRAAGDRVEDTSVRVGVRFRL